MKLALLAIACLGLAFAAITWWALESEGVAVVETRTAEGASRSTHVWFVEPDGELWVEAGTPENPWFLDIRRESSVGFEADGRPSTRYRAEPVEGAEAHDRVRALLRSKYGFRDSWVGLLVDTSDSVAVRLVPE